jgi:hypothetical protein
MRMGKVPEKLAEESPHRFDEDGNFRGFDRSQDHGATSFGGSVVPQERRTVRYHAPRVRDVREFLMFCRAKRVVGWNEHRGGRMVRGLRFLSILLSYIVD